MILQSPTRKETLMIRHPLGLRLDPDGPVRDQIHEAARLGARGVVRRGDRRPRAAPAR